jgi:LacI family repressor for deo operon, udp, cdd, tsx, nupC, and nupG
MREHGQNDPRDRIVRTVPTVNPSWLMATRNDLQSRATIADVARVAGVNKGTASRALRGVSGVGPVTRQRIIQVAESLQFSASHLATALATGHSKTVGIVIPSLRSWYFTEFASGASEVLIPAGFRVELINLAIDSDLLQVDSIEFGRLFNELGAGRGRDALLFAGTNSEVDPDLGSTASVPAVATGHPMGSVPGIVVDNRAGGQLVGEYLLTLGHTRVAVMEGQIPAKTETRIWDLRTDGLRDTLSASGLDIPEDCVVCPGDCQPADGERAMREILELSEIPTAVFCHTDEMAFGALSVLRQAGLSCPGDMTIVGFDDHPMSRYWGLTTISQHAHEQGIRAARALMADLDGGLPEGTGDEPELAVELVVRETSARPRTAC